LQNAIRDAALNKSRDDALHIGRQELIDLLKEIEVHLEVNQLPEAGTETLPGKDVDTFKWPTEWMDAGAEIATLAEIASRDEIVSQIVDEEVDPYSRAVSDQPVSYTDA